METWLLILIIIIAAIIFFTLYGIFWHFFLYGRPITLSETQYETKTEFIEIKLKDRNIKACLEYPKTDDKVPLVVCAHGFGGSYKGCKCLVGDSLARSGIATLMIEFYGGNNHSISGGKMIDMTPLREKEELDALINKAFTLDQFDLNNVYLFGESQGGLISSMSSLEFKGKLKGLILYYPAFCILESCYEGKYKKSGDHVIFGHKVSDKYFSDARKIKNLDEKLKDYKDPVLIIHGSSDHTVNVKYGIKASKLYPHSKLIILKHQDHGFNCIGKRKAVKEVYNFINENKEKNSSFDFIDTALRDMRRP